MSKPKKVFIEKRKDEGDYAVRKPDSERASTIGKTQQEAIEAAKEMFPDATILVERVKETDKGKPYQWRSV